MIKIREVEDRDLIPLSEFLPEGFPYTTKGFWISIFNYWWTSNPAYTDQMPRGWILLNDNEIVGFIGNIPVKFLDHGTGKIAFASNSWYVNPVYRGVFSLSLFNKFINQKHNSIALFKTDDDEHKKIVDKYNFDEHILPWNQMEYFYIINKKNIGYIFKKFIFNPWIPKLPDLQEISARVVGLLHAYLFQKSIVQEYFFPGKDYTYSFCTSCDDTFSRIWEPFIHTCNFTLSRDTETLNWLYFSSTKPHQNVVVQCRRSSDKKLIGYMVFEIILDKKAESGIMHLTEMCLENNDLRVLESLTSFAFETAKKKNITLFVVRSNSQESEDYFQNNFSLKRKAQYHRYIRFSDANKTTGDHGTTCLPLIYPPQ